MTPRLCAHHESYSHDIFLSYRQNPDKHFTQDLAFLLERRNHPRENNVKIRTFIDLWCLTGGFQWQEGFLNALVNSKVIVLVISERALEGVVEADSKPDNLLLEWEYALDSYEQKKAAIFPLFVGEIKHYEGEELYKKFNMTKALNLDRFPAVPHRHPKSSNMGRTIRQVIENICMIQGLFVDPNTPGGEVGEIIKRLELFLLEEGSHNESESMARSPHGQDFRTAQPLLSPPPLPPRTMGTTNLANYTGTWTLKGRHLYHEDVLAAQGVSYASRKLIAYNQGVANLVGLNYVIFNDIVADKDVKLRDCMPTLAVDYTWLVDGQEHEIPQVFFGAVKYVCSRNDRGFIVLRTWSGTWGAKKKWENLAVWEVNGDTMIRKNVFKSPKLNKEFELVFTKKA